MSKLITARSLPPNVKGKSRGNVELKIHDLRWKTNTAHYFSGGIQAKIIWWGESFQTASVLKFNPRKTTDSSSKTIKYNILTSPKLFQEYIKTCEPIEIKLTSEISNLQIGTVFVQIPRKIINLLSSDETCGFTAYHKSTHQIFSPKNRNIGEIVIGIEMTIAEKPNSAIVTPISLIDNRKGDKNYNLKLNESSQNMVAERDLTSILSAKSVPIVSRPISGKSKSLATSTKTFDYLSGRQMTEAQELEALHNLKELSPTNSLVEKLSEEVYKISTAANSNYLRKIDSIKISVLTLILSKAGIREIKARSLNSCGHIEAPTFTVECKINALLTMITKNANGKYFTDFENVKMSSKIHGSDLESRIEFNKDVIRTIAIPKTDSPLHSIHFKIWFREIGMRESIVLGTTSIPIKTVTESFGFSVVKKCSIVSICGDIIIGTLSIKLELGNRGLHFGPDFLEAVSYNKENISDIESVDENKSNRNLISYRQRNDFVAEQQTKCCRCKIIEQNPTPRKCNQDDQDPRTLNQPVSSDRQCNENQNNHPKTNHNNTNDPRNNNNGFVNVEGSPHSPTTSNVLYGLVYMGAIHQFKKPPKNIGTFMICRSFWKRNPTATNMCDEDVFNFLEVFPIVCDAAFFDRTKNQFLNLEMWQRGNDEPEQMIGTTSLPLHQFYVAFKDQSLMNHLRKVKLPVISIDGWTSIVSPLTLSPVAKLQVILAIGTEEQLEYLKASRGLSIANISEKEILQNKITIPNGPIPISMPSISNAQTQTNFGSTLHAEIQTTETSHADIEIQTNLTNEHCSNAATNTATADRQATFNQMLNTFIDSLAIRLPERIGSDSSGPQIRRTSDLLDALQKALTCPPPPNVSIPIFEKHIDQSQNIATNTKPPQQRPVEPEIDYHFQVLIEIESALHLPKVLIRVNKKCTKQRSRCNKNQSFRGISEIEPSTYATFEAEGPPTSVVNSHEGPVYTTNVCENSCNPQWNKRFDIMLPFDLLGEDEKPFIIKIWRKASTDIPQARLLPNPMEDVMVGFAAIDLSVLLLGMPSITGWFNIVDYSGRTNGQIKVSIQPSKNLSKYQQFIPQSSMLSDIPPTAHPLMMPLTIDTNTESGSSILSRTLKRKFTELEEITQRLKARLFDITGDENTDPDDEFEKDLNTHPDEDESVVKQRESQTNNNTDFDWLRGDNVLQSGNMDSDTIELQNILARSTAGTSKLIFEPERNISGCSERIRSTFDWDNLLQCNPIDEIINPNLIKQLINPNEIGTSEESTPQLIDPATLFPPDDDNDNNDDDDDEEETNSLFDTDRIRLISSALQKAIIDDTTSAGTEKSYREAPDGGTNSVKEK